MKVRIALALVLVTGLAGCSSLNAASDTGSMYNTPFGASRGSLAENEANSAIASLLTNEFAKVLTSSDHRALAQAQAQALQTDGVGASIVWKNEKTGRSGSVRPGPVYLVNETACREFVHEILLDGNDVKSRGTACKTEKGRWQTLS